MPESHPGKPITPTQYRPGKAKKNLLLLIDELEHRIAFIVDRYNVSEKQAARIVNNEDKRRLNLYRRLGKEDYDNPGLYHLVLNMNRFNLEKASSLICKMIEK